MFYYEINKFFYKNNAFEISEFTLIHPKTIPINAGDGLSEFFPPVN